MNDLSRAWRAATTLALAMGLVACGGVPAKRQAELAQLSAMLPGTYDNTLQASSEGQAAVPALRLAIVPVYAPLVGRDIFYVQEMAADDARRVTAQRLVSLEVTPDGKLVQGLFAFGEPARWRDGHEKPDLFKSLLPQDLRLLEGCELVWHPSGRAFKGENDPRTCRVSDRGSGATVHQASKAEVDSDGIAFSDTVVESAGTEQAWLRFRRRAN